MHIPKRFTQVGRGIWCDLDPVESDIREHYRNDMEKILNDDLEHYIRFCTDVVECSPIMRHYNTVADIGGGCPKLASTLSCEHVTVYDAQAKDYEAAHDMFEEVYRSMCVSYVEQNICDRDFRPSADLAIFSHVLEHLTVTQTVSLLSRIDCEYALVYQPNVARANDDNWFHYAPADHITFTTMSAMVRIFQRAGYTLVYGTEFDEDYCLYFRRTDG